MESKLVAMCNLRCGHVVASGQVVLYYEANFVDVMAGIASVHM